VSGGGGRHDPEPRADEELWRLTKDTRTAVCSQRLHPLGLELRIDVDGDTRMTRVSRSVDEAWAERERLRMSMEAKGWRCG